MNEDHDHAPLSPRQQLLADVLIGARSPDTDEVRAACADPAFARMLGELLAVRDRLDRASAAERRAVAEPTRPVDEQVATLVRRLQPHRARWPLHPGTWGLLLAAVLVLGLGLGIAWWRGEPDTSGLTLTGHAPLDCRPGYAAITWQADPGIRRFEVRVKRGTQQIDRSGPLRATSWEPQAAKRQSYGPEVTIELWSLGIDEGDERLLASGKFAADGSRR